MTPPAQPHQSAARSRRVFALAAALLFAAFYADVLGVAGPAWFDHFSPYVEAHVVGRLAKSRRDGVFSAGGLPGVVRTRPGAPESEWTDPALKAYQYQAYCQGLPFTRFDPYLSQIGGQGICLSVLDRLLPVAPYARIEIFHVLTAALSALALAWIVLWFDLEFGAWVAASVLASMVLSPWMTVFGRQLWWSLWAFYLPLGWLLHHLRRHPAVAPGFRPVSAPLPSHLQRPLPAAPSLPSLALVVFADTGLKCFFNGYEYITTFLLMMGTPVVYYGVRDAWPRACFARRGAVVAGAALLGVTLSVAVLMGQTAAAEGSFQAGVNHLVMAVERRTMGSGDALSLPYRQAVRAPAWDVVQSYLNGPYFQPNPASGFPPGPLASHLPATTYGTLIAIFALAGAVVICGQQGPGREEESRQGRALLIASGLALLAPLSWFVVFKGHSVIHMHLNFIAWHMPLTLFGFAVCTLAVQVAWRALSARLRSPRTQPALP